MSSSAIATLRGALRYARPNHILLLAILAIAASVAAQLAMPWTVGRIIDDAIQGHDAAGLLRWCVILTAAALALVTARGASELGFASWRETVVLSLIGRMLHKLHRLPVATLDAETTGGLHARFYNDAVRVGQLYGPVVRLISGSVIQLGLALVVLAVQFGALALWAVAVLPAYLICPMLFGRGLRKASADLQVAEGEYGARLQESIRGAREIKAFDRADWSYRRIESAVRRARGFRLRVVGLQGGYNLQVALYWGILAVAYWLGGRRVLAGEISIGQLVAFVGYLGVLSAPLDGLVSAHGQIQATHGAFQRLSSFLNAPAELDAGTIPRIASRPPSLEVDDVSFTYPGRRRPTLRYVAARIEEGERVAIVGPSGAGKSTLLKLVLRYYEPHGGVIRLDRIDIRDYSLPGLRAAIGVVAQEPTIFSGTVRDNIRFGNGRATDADIESAARSAHAEEFIRQLPRGYDTALGEHGLALSAGQRQRLALARALVRDPAILLLDEPTSALDAVSERAVQTALHDVVRNRTSIVVAHRLATAVAADRILVMNDGRIVASGTHYGLLGASPLYRQLYQTSLDGLVTDGRPGSVPADPRAPQRHVATG